VSVASAGADGTMGRLLQSNRYDGEGLRYETEENGKVIRFLFDRGELAQENREDDKISYVRGHRAISLSRNGEDRNYYVQDEMGSTLFLLDQAHEIRKTYRYDAFGNILKETGDIPNRLTYTGQIYDGAAIQYYLRARFYNPAIGRFIQEDTYRGDGLNLYAYCANNPVVYYDPSGYTETTLSDDGCPPQGNIGGGDNDDGSAERDNQSGLNDIISLIQEGEITEYGRNIINHLDDGTTVIFRRDIGNYAHAISSQGYPDPVDYINIEIQVPTPRGGNKPKWDFHIILDDLGDVIDTFMSNKVYFVKIGSRNLESADQNPTVGWILTSSYYPEWNRCNKFYRKKFFEYLKKAEARFHILRRFLLKFYKEFLNSNLFDRRRFLLFQ
jgi:RHS repeat-associated protein